MTKIGIVAHLERLVQAEELRDRVNAAYIAYDDGTLGCAENHRRVWEDCAHNSHDWTLVLEDDAQPIPQFQDQLNAVLDAAPTPIVSLYLGRSRPLGAWQGRIQLATTEANREGAHWIVSNHCLHAVAVAIRTPLIPSLLAHNTHRDLVADDALTAWAQRDGHEISYCWPSLVDHADGPTLTAHADGKPRHSGRVAWATGRRPRWNTRSVAMHGHAYRRR